MTLLLLVVVMLLLSLGAFPPYDFDLSMFPGGTEGVLVLVVVALLLTRRI